MQPLSGPAQTQTTDMLYTRAVGEHRHAAVGLAGGPRARRLAFNIPLSNSIAVSSPSLSLSLARTFFSPTRSLAHSVLLSDKRSTAD